MADLTLRDEVGRTVFHGTSKGGGSQPLTLIKEPCVVATTDDITLSGLQTVDFYAVQEGDRVLVMAQSSGTDNGIYVASAGAWTRAADADASGDLVGGTLVMVGGAGNAYNSSLWLLSPAAAPWEPDAVAVSALCIAGSHLVTGVSTDSGNTLALTLASTAGPINANSAQLKAIADPTDAQDAATKTYVDSVGAAATVASADLVVAQGNGTIVLGVHTVRFITVGQLVFAYFGVMFGATTAGQGGQPITVAFTELPDANAAVAVGQAIGSVVGGIGGAFDVSPILIDAAPLTITIPASIGTVAEADHFYGTIMYEAAA